MEARSESSLTRGRYFHVCPDPRSFRPSRENERDRKRERERENKKEALDRSFRSLGSADCPPRDSSLVIVLESSRTLWTRSHAWGFPRYPRPDISMLAGNFFGKPSIPEGPITEREDRLNLPSLILLREIARIISSPPSRPTAIRPRDSQVELGTRNLLHVAKVDPNTMEEEKYRQIAILQSRESCNLFSSHLQS